MKAPIYILFLFLTTVSYAQVTVTGKVIADDGTELPGATIVEKGTSNGVVSDYNGNYEISVANDATIVIDFTGFGTQEIPVGGQQKINITMAEDAVTIGEVEVTGIIGVVGKSRRRTESIQNVPESVSALNLEGIKRTGVTDISSFSTLVPNLKYNTSQAVGLNFITVRGIPQIRGGDAPVAFVIDGVTVPDPSLLNQELFDLALVEVVKGPQGALYGKNAIGGAINIYTQEPTNTFTNKIKLGYGNGNSLLGQLVSSGAIVKDKVYFRLSGQYKSTDGLLTNAFLEEKVDFRTDLNIRGQIKADLTDNLTASVTYQYFDLDGGAGYYSVNPIGSPYYAGAPGGIMDPNPRDGNNIIVADLLGNSDMKNHYGNLKFDYNIGGVKLQSITSFNAVDRSTVADLDFLDFPFLTQGEVASTNTFNQEFRVQNRNSKDKFNWSAGGFYQNVNEPVFQDGLLYDYYYTEPFELTYADLINNTSTVALFGFADYKITDKFTASAGFRYDIDKFDQEDIFNVADNSRTNNEFQPKASLAYQATPDVLVFANYGRGYRTGGFNPSTTALFNRDFEDETSDNYELGIKTSSWNDRLIINAAAFYTGLNNQQQYILELENFFAGIYNYDKSSVLGFELDSRVRLSKFFDVVANYGFTNAEIIEGGMTGGENGDQTDNAQYDGNKVPFVPTNTFMVGLESSIPISQDLKFNGFINLNGTGKTYWHESNLDAHTTDAYNLLDARLGLEFKMFELELWGRNLTDTQYYQEFSPGQFVGSPDDVAWRGQPRSVGVAVSVKF